MKLVLTVENFSADKRESLVSIFKEFVMPDEGLHIYPSNIQLLHRIIWLFVTSALYGCLMNDETTLPNGYYLYRDNAYVNDTFMTMPYPLISSGPKDAYNFYHSQVRINIECAFGILVNWWCILKMPLSAKIPII